MGDIRFIVDVGCKSRTVSKSRLGRFTYTRSVRGAAAVLFVASPSLLLLRPAWLITHIDFILTASENGTISNNSGSSSGSGWDSNDGVAKSASRDIEIYRVD